MRGLGIKNPMFFIGIVENNDDEQLQGRVQVRAFGIHGTNAEVPTVDLPWAICVSGHYDPNSPIPPNNSFVYGMFLDGDQAQHPLILGMIPTQYVEEMDPEADGYGVIPKDGNYNHPLFKGFRPDDFGEHQSSKLRRGENIEESIHNTVDTNRVKDQRLANNNDQTWSQPPSAYSTRYPYNRVVETAAHTIELDDTPGGERIMIHHKSGSFVQIDAIGTVTERAEGDRYEINIGTKHESSAASVVTINGNAHVYVKGNKTEEIEGDYKLHVRGNMEIGTGSSLFLNAGHSLQARGSITRIEAMTDALTLFGKQQIQIEAEKQVNTVSQNIKQNALLSYDVFSPKGFKFTTPLDFHVIASNIILQANGLIPPSSTVGVVSGTIGTPIQAGLNITAPSVNIAAATGSITGAWNAAAVNTLALNSTLISAGTISATVDISAQLITATKGNFTTIGAPLPAGPVSYNPLYIAPVVIPELVAPIPPVINLPAASWPLPPLFGIASGWAYPRGNGEGFIGNVLSGNFFATLVPGILPSLEGGGYGITRAQMPEPPATSLVNDIPDAQYYSSKGFVPGTYNTTIEDDD